MKELENIKTRNDIIKLIKELEKIKYDYPLVKNIRIQHRGVRVNAKLINHSKKKKVNLSPVIKRLGRVMFTIDDLEIIVEKNGLFRIKVKGKRKIIAKHMKLPNSSEFVELVEDKGHPIVGMEPFEFEGSPFDLTARYVAVDAGFNIIG